MSDLQEQQFSLSSKQPSPDAGGLHQHPQSSISVDFQESSDSGSFEQPASQEEGQPFSGQQAFAVPSGSRPQSAGKLVAFALIGLAVGLLLGGGLGLFAGFNIGSSHIGLPAPVDNRQNIWEGYVAEKGITDAVWSQDDLLGLNTRSSSQQGITVDRVINEYGQASNVAYSAEGLVLEWRADKGSDFASVQLTFQKEEGDYHLFGIAAYDWEGAEEMSQGDYDKLRVGDRTIGRDGVSSSQVLKEHGKPRSIRIEFDPDEEKQTLGLFYQGDEGKPIFMYFISQDDGSFLLNYKSSN